MAEIAEVLELYNVELETSFESVVSAYDLINTQIQVEVDDIDQNLKPYLDPELQSLVNGTNDIGYAVHEYRTMLIASVERIQTCLLDEDQRMEDFEQSMQDIVEATSTRLWGVLNWVDTCHDAEQRLQMLQEINNPLLMKFFIGKTDDTESQDYFFVVPKPSLYEAKDGGLQAISLTTVTQRLQSECSVHGLCKVFVEAVWDLQEKRRNRLESLRMKHTLNEE